MALWGGKYNLEDVSVTKDDFKDFGPGSRFTTPSVPLGICTGKFGNLSNETITRNDFKSKKRIEALPYRHKVHFILPKPLKFARKQENSVVNVRQNRIKKENLTCDKDWPTSDKRKPNIQKDLNCDWPPAPESEWDIPDKTPAYVPITTLRMSGKHKRMKSTYTEDLGTIGIGEVAHYDHPPKGVLPYGSRSTEGTEYKSIYSGEILRPKGYTKHSETRKKKMIPNKWETSYTTFCKETLDAPSWIKDFMDKPLGYPAPQVKRI